MRALNLDGIKEVYFSLICKAKETDISIIELRKMLLNFDILKPLYFVSVSIDQKVINLTPAAVAICAGKIGFFEVITDLYPGTLCLDKIDNVALHSPLMCAIDSCMPTLVTAVLRNEHFIAHEFHKPVEHKAHIQYCMSQISQHIADIGKIPAYPIELNNIEILGMLKNVLEIRMPIICAMKQNDFAQMATIAVSTDFNSIEHKTCILDCIKCTKKWCNNSEGKEWLLQSVLQLRNF